MIQQLVQRLIDGGMPKLDAASVVLTADPLDLILYMEKVWDRVDPPLPAPPIVEARQKLYALGRFDSVEPVNPAMGTVDLTRLDLWDHFAYAYVLENTRVVQILRRIVRAYRTGEALGAPSQQTRKWVEATEALLFGAANPLTAWLSVSNVRADPEMVRRNAYWRMFGLDLAFGGDDNSAPVYDKAQAANTGFAPLFEELLFELWQAIGNERNFSGVNQSDDDRIFRIAEQLRFILRARRQTDMLRREELSAATALGWAELTVSFDSPVVLDLGANASNPADRLRTMGERVGLPSHSMSAAFFSMAKEISIFLRTIESGIVSGTDKAWVLYATRPPVAGSTDEPVGSEARRVITEWAAATGKNLKERSKPVDVRTPRLVSVK
jgi:hypothetical protein